MMIVEREAHAKINWALWILGRRPDGYHELDMLMQTVGLCDRLRLEDGDELTLYVDGVKSDDEDNLVMRAARALRSHAGARRGARISLEKRIPSRAGLGGGSADCAATLRALDELWHLNLSEDTLRSIGLKLGADVPYCLTGGLCRVRGVGEKIERLQGGPRLHVALSRLSDGLSTADVFRAWDNSPSFPPLNPEGAARALLAGDFDRLRQLSHNALAAPAAFLLLEIPDKIRALYDMGAAFAAMSGSGSTVYGVFPSCEEADEAARMLGKNAIVTETLPQ
jgi:4-diphosphocytidyl-2-C-methyl-D-erythritol kinase